MSCMMNNFLLYLISAALLVTLCNGQCYDIPNNITDGCLHEGTKYKLNTTWHNSQCHSCSCSTTSHTCCAKYPTPTGFSNDCIAFFDEKNCVYRVVRKDDPCQICNITEAIF
ncbi:beta-microseminoprotein-like [Discoglossus pictus]